MPRVDIEAEFVVATGLNDAGLRLLFYVLLTEFTSSWPELHSDALRGWMRPTTSIPLRISNAVVTPTPPTRVRVNDPSLIMRRPQDGLNS